MPSFLEPYLWMIKAALILALLAALTYAAHWIHENGKQVERAVWVDKEHKELVAANAEILRLTERAKKDEADHLQRLADIGSNHQKEIAKNDAQKTRDIADARSGAIGLRFHATCPRTDSSQGSEAGTATVLGDGRTEVELSPETVDALYQIVNDADRNTDQLREAKAVILEDRRLCGQN